MPEREQRLRDDDYDPVKGSVRSLVCGPGRVLVRALRRPGIAGRLFALGCLAPSPAHTQASGALPLFASDEPLPLTLTADLPALERDRRSSPDRPAVLTLPALGAARESARRLDVPAEVRTRGAFRLDPVNCSFPPLRIDVDGSDADNTALEGQDDLKLVSSCRPGRDSYDELVRLEYLVYRTYELVATIALGTRWVELTLVDETGVEEVRRRGGFLIEDDEALAERLGGEVFELEEDRNLPSTALEPSSALTNAIFQYMVGNPDWSDVAGHNVELVERGGAAVVVPYDFDFTGLVDAPYAVPPEALRLSSVRERVYRGWCAHPLVTASVLARFRDAEQGVRALWADARGLSDDTRRRTISYLEEFFDDIETDERAERRFLRDCRRPA